MKKFLDKDFLLTTDTARRLYHEVAAKQPIIDYHNHLPPADIAQNRQFANLYEAWLEGDHYKWRAMRSAGIEERFCTGDASPKEKFDAWAATVPRTLGNPLYHWTHLELRRYFGIEKLLSPETADEIWDEANAKLADPAFSARGLLKMMNVELVCTTDDPADDLAQHQAHRAQGSPEVKMHPAFRPDKAHNFSSLDDWKAYIFSYFFTLFCTDNRFYSTFKDRNTYIFHSCF
jgi:glucuronate isomerase